MAANAQTKKWIEETSNVKECESRCPKCGASVNEINWDATDFGDTQITQKANCTKCGCWFTETSEINYLYTKIDEA